MFHARNRLRNPWRFTCLCTLHKCTKTLLGNHISLRYINLSGVQKAKTCSKCPTHDISNPCLPRKVLKKNKKAGFDCNFLPFFSYTGVLSCKISKRISNMCPVLTANQINVNVPKICLESVPPVTLNISP